MAGTTGIGTTFSLPNYHGELLAVTPSDTPFLSAIGAGGGKQTTSTSFEWQTYDLRQASQPGVLEGATAPTAEERVRANVSNVVQIHQEQVAVSYTKQAAIGQYATPSSAPYRTAGGVDNPVNSELDWQIEQALKTMALDVNWSFINGKYNAPSTNAAARKTKGLLQAVTSNVESKAAATITNGSAATDTITATHAFTNGEKVVFTDRGASTAVVEGRVYFVVERVSTTSFKVSATSGGTAITIGTATVSLIALSATAVTTTVLGDVLQKVYDNGGLTGGMGTLLVNSPQKRAITVAYANEYGKADLFAGSREIAGVNALQIQSDFGVLNVIMDRHVPRDAIIVCSLDQCAPVFLNIPGKGVFFEEPLAKTGASDAVQLYGEVGLQFGNEKAHGVIRGLPA